MKFRFKDQRMGKILSMDKLLVSLVKEFKLEESFIVESVRSLWSDIVGNVISTHSIPDRIFKNTLFISVDHPMYSNELIMIKDGIIERLNDEFGANIVINIKTEIKSLKWKKS